MKKEKTDKSISLIDSEWQNLYKIGSFAALLQLLCTLMTVIVIFTFGLEPSSAIEYFTVLQNNRMEGLLRIDFSSLFNVALFSITALAIYISLVDLNKSGTTLATVFTYLGISIAMATHSAFSMIHLSDQYAEATTEEQKSQFIAAGEAVIASGWWNSTAAFMAGLFLQGGLLILSIVMLKSNSFHKFTAIAGSIANGFDLAHHIIDLFIPSVAEILGIIGGSFYLIWYPLLSHDLYYLGKS